MAVLDLDGESGSNIEKTIGTHKKKFINDGDIKTSTIFNKDTRIEDIARYIGGYNWEVDYFIQIRKENDLYSKPDIEKSVSILKYNRINNLIIHLLEPLSTTVPEELTGSGIIDAGFIPNYGDVILVTLTNGRDAFLTIEKVEKKSYSNRDVYQVEFKLFTFIDSEPEIYNDVLYKTIKEFVYDRDNLIDYSTPIIISKDYKKKINLKTSYNQIITYYFERFFKDDINLIILPTNRGVYFDPNVTVFLFKILSINEHLVLNKLNRIEKNDGRSIYDILDTKDITAIHTIKSDIGYIPTKFETIIGDINARYLGVTHMVSNVEESVIKVEDVFIGNDVSLPNDYVYPIGRTNLKYVFTEAFYNLNYEKMGSFERVVYKYLNNETINYEDIKLFIEQYKYWETDEQYYLIPILLLMIKDSRNFMYLGL